MNKCYLCDSRDLALVADREDIRFGCFGYDKQVLKCEKCGLIQLLPIWTEDELNLLYAKYSEKKDFKGARPKQTISRYLRRYLKKGDRVLEIGCSFGDNLRNLRRQGYEVIGIDRDPTVCDGRIILNYDFKDFVKKGEKFDFIYAIHVFEHITDPREFLKMMKDSLKPGGRFLLEIPSASDPLLNLYKVENFRKYYWYPYHLFFYDRETARKLIGESRDWDLRIVPLQRYGLVNHLRWLIFKRPGNFNSSLPLLDKVYKYILTRILKSSDTLIVTGEKRGGRA